MRNLEAEEYCNLTNRFKNFLLAALLNYVLLYSGCKEEEKYVMTEEDSLRIKLTAVFGSLEKEFSKRPPKYLLYKPNKAITYSRLVSKFGNRGTEIILALNRIDRKNLKRNEPLVVPDTIITIWKKQQINFIAKQDSIKLANKKLQKKN